MSLSPEPDPTEVSVSPQVQDPPVSYTLEKPSPESSEDLINIKAEVEILTYDLETERQKNESLVQELAEKEKSLSVTVTALNEKRVEIAKLKQKCLELNSVQTEKQTQLEAQMEVLRTEANALKTKLEQSEKTRVGQFALCKNKMKEMKMKYKMQIAELKQLLMERHSRYKEKENTFLSEQSRISSQLEQFQEKVMQFCGSKASTARSSATTQALCFRNEDALNGPEESSESGEDA